MVKNIENKFGDDLRKLVRKKYPTYARAAEDLDISVSFLHQLMRGERNPSFEMIQKLIKILGSDEIFLTEQKKMTLQMATEMTGQIKEQRKKRLEFLAWEMNLDESNPKDRETLDHLLTVLPHLKNIPADVLIMLAHQNEKYFESLRRVLNKIEEKKISKLSKKETV